HESGVTNTVDPLAGSFFVEALTNEMERGVYDYFRQIDDRGGVIPALEQGYIQREIGDSAYRYQREIDSGERTIVGVNDYVLDEEPVIPVHQLEPDSEARHLARLARVRRERDGALVSE